MDVVIDTEGSWLLFIKKTPIEDHVGADTILELIFEEHSGVCGDSVTLKMSNESIQRLKELL